MKVSKAVAELGRRPNPIYKKKYQPKHRKDGTFKKPRLGKYNNRGFRLDGRFFHSEAEAGRYMQLKLLETERKISHLECQVPYQIHIEGALICTYYADFRYVILSPDGSAKAMVIEDVKGLRTKEYEIKKKLVEAKHRIQIVELNSTWLKHFDGLHAHDCLPVIAELEARKKERRKALIEKRRLARLAAKGENTDPDS